MTVTTNSSYDPIAEMYHKLWADWYLPAALTSLDRLFFSQIQSGSKVLDVCCGSGHVTRELVRRGYQVTAIDASAGLIALGKKDWPQVDWRVQDARHLQVGKAQYAAALSTFDSLNHLSSIADLEQVFRSVKTALERDGLFVFDMNLEEAFLTDVRRWTVEVGETNVSLIRGSYDPETKTAQTELLWFVRIEGQELWKQYRSVVDQRSFTQQEILIALRNAGFRDIEAIPAAEAGMTAELGFGRLFVTARS